MRIEPKGFLLSLLQERGIPIPEGGLLLDDLRLERFKLEADQQAHWNEEEKQAMAVYMALTHPGWKGSKLQKEFSLVDSVPFSEEGDPPQEESNSLIMGESLPSWVKTQEFTWKLIGDITWRFLVLLALLKIMWEI